MKLVVLGAPRPLHLNRWKDDIAEAAVRLGWDVTHLPARDIPADDVVRECKGTDLLIWARTHGHNPVGDLHGMLRRIEDAGTATVALHLDLYWGIVRREHDIASRHPWWSCQWVFTADGGVRPWGRWGIRHRWLPPPMGHRFYGRGRPSAKLMGKAAFVGSYVPRIHGPHRKKLLDWAHRRYGLGFSRYGAFGPKIWGGTLNDLFASVEVVVGDSAPAPCYWSDRVPITLGRGGLLAHPRTPGMDGQGFTDEVMVPFDRLDFAGLGRRLDALTAADRLRITDNALTLVGERHMWTHRLQTIQQVVFG